MAKLSQLDTFIKALEDWNTITNPRVSHELLIASLCRNIGCERLIGGSNLEALRDRAEELIIQHGIDEDFLVTGLVNSTTEFLQQQMMYHGRAILLNEKAANQDERGEHLVGPVLHRLKDHKYISHMEIQLATWEKIVSEHLSWYERMKWEDERLARLADQVTEQMETVPDEIQDLLWEFPLVKLLKHVSFKDMSSLTVEQAQEIRKKILAEEQ